MIVQTSFTLNKGHGHPNLYQNVELIGPYHHTKFEPHWPVNVCKQAKVKFCFFPSKIT